MTKIELEALEMIRGTKDPAAAIMTAFEVITDFLLSEQRGCFEEQEVGPLAG